VISVTPTRFGTGVGVRNSRAAGPAWLGVDVAPAYELATFDRRAGGVAHGKHASPGATPGALGDTKQTAPAAN
jgi:hypothetical protein